MNARILVGLLLFTLATSGQAEDKKTARGGYMLAPTGEVATVLYDWHDTKRDRKVPVKVYFPKLGKGPFPVIIFSHGLGGTREGYEYLGRDWAARGYVSVHVQHIGSDDGVWRDTRLTGRMAAMKRAVANPATAIARPRDVSFVIDQLEKLNAGDSVLAKKLDLNRIGVAGHSFGAFTALAVAGETFLPRGGEDSTLADPRVKAAIVMSAPVSANRPGLDAAFAKIKIPCFHMTGTDDMSPIGDTAAKDRRLPYDYSNGSDQFLIIFKDGDHMVFSGRERMLPSKKDARFQQHIRESSAAFWDAYLRGEPEAKSWLTNGFKPSLGKDGMFEFKLKK